MVMPMVRVGLVLLLLLAGCSSSPDTPGGSPDAPPSPTKEAVTVVVARTGGFAGVMDTITVSGDGSWTHPTALNVNGKLDAAQVANLQKLATDPRLDAEAATTAAPTMCNDAFDYTVTAGQVTISFTDCPGDAFQPVVAKQIVDFVQDAISK
jgi:hypothetical protein